MKREEKAKHGEYLNGGKPVNMKCVHVTLHNLENGSLDFWLEKGMSFRPNTVACLVGLEENHEEGKGLHAHIVIQFSTRQKLSRKQFVDHFGTDSLHIAVKPNKNAIVMALGYVVKAGTFKQEGDFIFRGEPLESNPDVYRFQYTVQNVDDGLRYFRKVIRENITDKSIIEKYAERDDIIGDWLRKHGQHKKTLINLAHTWNLAERNKHKEGFEFADFMNEPDKLRGEYEAYLNVYPSIFAKHKKLYSGVGLEPDFKDHAAHDLSVLKKIVHQLREAKEYGSNRPHKCLNLFIWSRSPSFGKTRLMDFLDAHMMAYRLPDDQYYIDYKNDVYTVLVSDEAARFLTTKTYGHLKQIFEGKTVEFNMKGKTKGFKEDNPLIVLAENSSFDSLMRRHYKYEYTPEVMATRVLDLELRSRATLHFFLDRCIFPSTKATGK